MTRENIIRGREHVKWNRKEQKGIIMWSDFKFNSGLTNINSVTMVETIMDVLMKNKKMVKNVS